MDRIYTIGKIDDTFAKEINYSLIELDTLLNDEEIHDFIIQSLVPIPFDRLIIPLSRENEFQGIRIGLHIRLTKELHERRLVPILFVATENLEVILRSTGSTGHLLGTKGCSLEKPIIKVIQSAIGLIDPLQPDDMIPLLKLIQLQPDEKTGRHALANQWGAYILDSVAGTRALSYNSKLIIAQKQLYFKFVVALNYDNKRLKLPYRQVIALPKKMERINALNKRVLLIDDEADKGWSDVLGVMFKTQNSNDFQVIAKQVSNWANLSENDKKSILDSEFDLFLVDLRLSGSDETDMVNPEAFSGTSVLKAIKENNEGNQVIMFTASNKAWNLKSLLDIGADGYYIKESPEYNFPESFSVENFQNFKTETEQCLEYSFLRIVWANHKQIYTILNQAVSINKYSRYELYLIKQITDQFDIAFKLLQQKRQSQSRFYFLVTYYRILELLADMFISVDRQARLITFRTGTPIHFIQMDENKNIYSLVVKDDTVDWEWYNSTANRTLAICFEKLSFDLVSDANWLSQIRTLTETRNAFIHPKKTAIVNVLDLINWSETFRKIFTRL